MGLDQSLGRVREARQVHDRMQGALTQIQLPVCASIISYLTNNFGGSTRPQNCGARKLGSLPKLKSAAVLALLL